MGRKPKYTKETKIKVIKEYIVNWYLSSRQLIKIKIYADNAWFRYSIGAKHFNLAWNLLLL